LFRENQEIKREREREREKEREMKLSSTYSRRDRLKGKEIPVGRGAFLYSRGPANDYFITSEGFNLMDP
jgi:hypothetical protein